MNTKRRILLQLDTDPHPSVFDSVVACDAGAELLLRHGNVEPAAVRDLVYGLMFTRGGEDLRGSAIFVGGTDVAAADAVLTQVLETFFGPVRVSVMADPSGASTTAAAAVVLASRHIELAEARVAVLGATGPVGRRVARLLVHSGAQTYVASRSLQRAAEVAQALGDGQTPDNASPCETSSPHQLDELLKEVDAVIAAGTPGICLLHQSQWQSTQLKLVIDLNAVPPLGIEGIRADDRAVRYGETVAYGALGVGKTKMKIHKAAIERLFQSNDRVYDVDALFELARTMAADDATV